MKYTRDEGVEHRNGLVMLGGGGEKRRSLPWRESAKV